MWSAPVSAVTLPGLPITVRVVAWVRTAFLLFSVKCSTVLIHYILFMNQLNGIWVNSNIWLL